MKVTFEGSDVPADDHAEIRAALLRLEAGAGRGQWPQPVDRIAVGRRLSGAGGALVFEATLHRGDESLSRVIKVGPAAAMHKEWSRYFTIIAPRQSELLLEIEAATPGARDPAQQRVGEQEAVVYQHVGEHAAIAEVRTLEELVAAAVRSGSPAAVGEILALISLLFQKARPVFYGSARVDPGTTSLANLNTSLGPDVVVEIDQTMPGRASLGDHPDRADLVRVPDVIAEQGRNIAAEPGEPIIVHLLNVVPGTVPVTAERDGVRVLLQVRDGTTPLVDLGVLGKDFTVAGKVAAWRAQRTYERVREKLGGDEPAGLVGMFEALPKVLDQELPGRARSLVHGDLNAGNVLIAGDRPYLIDYARAASGQPLLADFTWLEINLLRRAISGELTFAELIRLQTLLAAGTVCWFGTDEAERDAIVNCLAPGDRIAPALRILARLRWEAQRSYPPAASPFWPEYQRHLLLAAHRTFKWDGDSHQPEHWRASVAAGIVAATWLGRTPLAGWADQDLEGVLAPLLRAPARSAFVDLAGFGAAEADRRPARLPALNQALELARGVLARTRLDDPARPRSLQADSAAGPMIDLAGRLTATGERVLNAVDHLAGHHAILLTGRSGSGKSATLAALRNRVMERGTRIVVILRAEDLTGQTPATSVSAALGFEAAGLLTVGALHVTIDGWDNLDAAARRTATAWVNALRRTHPRAPVAVAARHAGENTPAGLATLELAEPRLEQVVTYLVAAAAQRRMDPSSVEDAAELVRALLERPADSGLRELVRTPLYVWLLGRRLARSAVPATVADLLGDELPHSSVAAELAVAELDGTAPPGDTDRLVERGVLQPDGRFTFPVYRDYFAARALADKVVPLAPRVALQRWQGALRLYVSIAGADEVVALAGAVDPMAVARLLSASRPQADALPPFARQTAAMVRDPGAGAAERARAADALALLGDPGTAALAEVATDGQLPGAVRAVALTRSGSPRAIFHALRDPQTPTVLRSAALRAARGTAALSVLVAAALTDDAAWPVADAAYTTLRHDRIQLTPAHRAAYASVVERRLGEIEIELPMTTVAATARRLQDERLRLLAQLPAARQLPALLARRFAIEIHDIVAATLDNLLRVIPEPADPSDVLTVHRLLDGSPSDILRLLERLQKTPAPQPLIVAATVHRIAEMAPGRGISDETRADALSLADRVATTEIAAGGSLEPAAALLRAATAIDPVVGLRLAYRLHRVLMDRDDSARLRWPWFTTMAHCQQAVTQWPALLAAGGPDTEMAVLALASAGFHLHAGVPPKLSWLSDDVRNTLWDLRPAAEPTWTSVEYLRAAATAGVGRALPMTLDLLADPTLAALTRTMPTGQSGVYRTTARAELLTVAGYLARRELDLGLPADADADADADAERAYRTLRDLDVGDEPSEVAGQAIGLAYLGDWTGLLDVLTPDPRLLTAARNAFRHWVPGPHTPTDLREQSQIAQWIAERLAATGLPPEVRSTLWESQFSEADKAGILPRIT
jgi:hypothetical protein